MLHFPSLRCKVDINSCHYLVDVNFPLHNPSHHEPRYARDSEAWDRVTCAPFLDAANSPMLTRMLYIGLTAWQERNAFGDYCLLKNRAQIAKIEAENWSRRLPKED